MDIKSKKWTSRLPVKIVCIVLIPVLVLVGMFEVVKIARSDIAYTRTDILFADIDNNDYFYDTHMNNTMNNVYALFGLQSEEHIRNMGCLEWRTVNWEINEFSNSLISYCLFSKGMNGDRYYGEFEPAVVRGRAITVETGEGNVNNGVDDDVGNMDDIGESGDADGPIEVYSGEAVVVDEVPSVYDMIKGAPEVQQMVEDAINSQLRDLYYASKWIDEMPGLSYYIFGGEKTWTFAGHRF